MSKPLWLALCDQWIAEHRGNTGLTIPFLVGATQYSGASSCTDVPSQKGLAKLLFELQSQCPKGRCVRIELCGTREKPVVKVASFADVQNVAELILARKGESRLYVSQTYPHKRTLDSATDALWSVIGEAVASRLFSYAGGTYRSLNSDEVAFIARAKHAA